MNEGYPLTGFSLKELSVLSTALEMYIKENKSYIKSYKEVAVKSCIALSDKNDTAIEVLVRAKTAFGIVSEREKVNAN